MVYPFQRSSIFINLLKTELYPYQREGALFALSAGRSLLGDDMGLGKTIQALADRAEQLDEELKTGGAAGFPAIDSGKGLEGLNNLLVQGAEFLMNLSQTLTAPTRESATPSSRQGLSPLLERDEVSGRSFLKIPMPEPEVIQTLLSSLGALLGGLTGGQKIK